MVKFNNEIIGTYNIIRWEGGMQNHIFNGQKVRDLLQNENTKQFIRSQLNDPLASSNEVVKIGSYQGTGEFHFAGSTEEGYLQDRVDKCQLSYNQQSQALIFNQFWQA